MVQACSPIAPEIGKMEFLTNFVNIKRNGITILIHVCKVHKSIML